MQFRMRHWEPIARGEKTLTFRRWRRPQAKVGGRYRVGEGEIEAISVDVVTAEEISSAEARAAGYASAAELLDDIVRNQRKDGNPNAPMYRVAFRWLGASRDPRRVLGEQDVLEGEELEELQTKLRRMDERSRDGAWTAAALSAIGEHPGRRAGDLAAAQGRETARFKTDVRKLKKLGLTISLETGYELSARGRVVLAALRDGG